MDPVKHVDVQEAYEAPLGMRKEISSSFTPKGLST